MNTKCIKLMTREEILADVVEETENSYTIRNPMVLIMTGEGQMAIVPWMPLASKEDITIRKDSTIVSYVPNSELINHYKQSTGGIVTAPAGVLGSL